MKKNSLIILISTLLCSCLSIYDECLTSSLSINIDLTEVDKNKGFMPFVCIMTVNQSITLNSGKVDTIVLNVVYPKSLPVAEMGIRNVQVKCSGQNVPFRFANDSLIFNTLSCQNEYSILYEVYASSFLSNGLSAENCYVGEFYLYDISSWYFTCPDMRLDVSDITSSDSLTVISSGVNTDNTEWSRHIKPNKKIDVIALHKRFYDHFANIQGRCYCNIFLRNFYNEKLEIDTVLNDYCQYNSDYIRITEHISNDASESKVTHIEKCLHMATSIFNTPPDTLSIIECLWGNDKYSGGQAISKNIILADTVFFLADNGALLHEMIHVCDELDYHITCKDSSLFFFSESMIEYLTRYILKKEAGIEYSACNVDDNYLKHKDLKPIFQICDNNISSHYTIYAYVPYVIEQFANRVGEDKFVELYKEFHQNCIQQQELSFYEFIRYCQNNGVSQKHIDEFVKSLRTVY